MGDTSNLGSWNGHFSRQKRRLHPLSPARMNCCWHLAAKTWLLPRGDSAIKHGNLTIKQWGFNLRVKHWDLAIKDGACIIKDCDLIIKHVVPQLIKNGGSAGKLILKHGDLFSHESWWFYTHEQLGLDAYKENINSSLPGRHLFFDVF
jgi:hypothetical protein